MELIGKIRPDLPLVVAALRSEVQYLDVEWPLLLTGVGKVAAATAVRGALTELLPRVVFNVGTAGALRPGVSGTQVVSRVIQHDFADDVIADLTGRRFGSPIELPAWAGSGVCCATGDVFVEDGMVRDRLAVEAVVCDMEGYAVAFAARDAGVPVAMVKVVSDPADESARADWVDAVDPTARAIATAVRQFADDVMALGAVT